MEKNRKLKQRITSTIIATGILTKIFAMQTFNEQKAELTYQQFIALGLIAGNDGLYQRQLSMLMLKDRPNMTRIINILEEKKLVNRVSDSNKRRIFKIFITEKGKEIHEKILPTVLGMRDVVVNNVSDEDIETCIHVLNKFQENIKDKVNMQI